MIEFSLLKLNGHYNTGTMCLRPFTAISIALYLRGAVYVSSWMMPPMLHNPGKTLVQCMMLLCDACLPRPKLVPKMMHAFCIPAQHSLRRCSCGGRWLVALALGGLARLS